jgi:outer membrane protein OmpA-like peptidoglycan-associated protein
MQLDPIQLDVSLRERAAVSAASESPAAQVNQIRSVEELQKEDTESGSSEQPSAERDFFTAESESVEFDFEAQRIRDEYQAELDSILETVIIDQRARVASLLNQPKHMMILGSLEIDVLA